MAKKKPRKAKKSEDPWAHDPHNPLRPTCTTIPRVDSPTKRHKGDGSFLGGGNGRKDGSFLRHG